jgi:hypothetical protein
MIVIACLANSSFAQQTPAQQELLIQLSVVPAAAPKPSLKYLLLPDLSEMNPGNPIEGYLKCYLEQYRFVFDEQDFDRRKMLLAMPLEVPPPGEAPGFSRFTLARLDAAARLDNPDWQILLKLRADGFETLIPDVQAMRALARALQARFRAEIAGGRIGDAIRTAKTMFAMARHLGEHPTLIGELVGIAIASIAITPLEELLEQPNCPNLYWALTNLPDPFVTCKTALEGERLTLWEFTRELDATAPMGADKIKKFIDRLEKLIGGELVTKKEGGIRNYIANRTKDEKKLAAARERLVEFGLATDIVKTFPPDQVILLDEARELKVRFDDVARLMAFSPSEFEALTEKTGVLKREPALFADALLHAQSAVVRAQGRITQRFALLRHVEALRMFAAEHKGVWPSKLSDVSVPLPDDPFTGKPFRYELVGSTAHVRGTPPKRAQDDRFLRVHYELTLKQ